MITLLEDDIEVDADLSITGQVKSLVAGVAPFVVASSILVGGLNSDLFEGEHGSFYLNYANHVGKMVSLSHLPDISSGSLLARYSAGDGDVQEVTLGAGLSLNPITGVLSTEPVDLSNYWTKAEADGRYRPIGWTPGLPDVLNVNNTAVETSIVIESSSGEGFVVDGGGGIEASLKLFDGTPFLTLGSGQILYDAGRYQVYGGLIRIGPTDPIHENDLTRKAYVDGLFASAPAGTVTNVSSGNLSGLFTTSVSNASTTPSIGYTLSSQSGYTVFARGSGSGVPSFQALVADHIPNLSAGKITSGTLPIARGGTGLGSVGTSGQMLRSNGSALEYFTPDYVSSALIGAANGIAPLDGSGKVPSSYLPVSGMQYQGTWNADTNTPALSDGTGVDGYFFRVTVAGTQNLGSGNITFSVGDDVIHNGSVWQRAPSGATATNLALGTITGTTIPVTNSNGSGFTLPAATTTLAGLLTASGKVNYDLAYSMRHDAITLSLSSQSYLTLSGQEITANQVDLASGHVTGVLPVTSGGTGAATLTGVLVGNGTSAFSAATGTANQLLRRNAANNAYEFFTPSYLTSFTETDPTVPAHVKTISSGDITNWNGKENAFSKGNLIEGAGISLSGTLTGRLVGSGNITIASTYTPQNLTWTAGSGNLAISGGSGANLDGRYIGALPGAAFNISNSGGIDLNTISGTVILRAEGGATNTPDGGAGVIQQYAQSDRGYQMWHSHLYDDNLWYRNRLTAALGWRSWYRVASTNWVINNTRSNTWVPDWDDVTGKPLVFAPDAHTLDSHSNVNISGPVSSQYLGWSGSAWVNMTLPAGVTYTGSTSITLSGSAFQRAALTGDVTASVNSNATIISAGAVTLGKMASLASNRIIGNNTGSAATPIALTASQVRTMLNVADGANNYTHPNSGVTGGSYNNVTVNAQGHVTAGSNIAYLVAADLANYVTTNTQQLSIGANKGFTGHIRISPSNTTAITSEENGFRFTRIAQGVQFVVDSPAGSAAAVIRGWSEHGIQLRLWEGGIQALAASYSSGGYTYLVRNNTSGNFETRTPGIADVTGLQAALDGKQATISIPQNTLMGRWPGAGTGAFQNITLGANLSLSGAGVLSATSSGGSVTSVNASVPTGLQVSGVPITGSGTIAITYQSGYAIPTTAKQTGWDEAADRWKGGNTPSGNDLNNAVQGGIKYWSNTTSNTPGGFGTVLTFVGSSSTGDGAASNTWINQLLANTTSDLYYRQSINNWSSWGSTYKIWTEKQFSQTSVNNWGAAYTWVNTYGSGLQGGPYVPTSRTVSAGTGLTGGGALNTNQTISFSTTWGDARYSQVGHTHSTLTRGTGLTGGNYNGGSAQTWAFDTSWGDARYTQHGHAHSTLTFGTGLNSGSYNGGSNQTISINFGTGGGQVAQGNDSRINNGQAAWDALGGYVPTSRTITINGVTQDLSSNRSWTVSGGITGSGSADYSAWWSSSSNLTYSGSFWRHTGSGAFAFGGAMNQNYRLTVGDRMLVSNTGSPQNYGSAILALESTNKGFRPPVMTTAQWEAISSKDAGLMAFCSDSNALVIKDNIGIGYFAIRRNPSTEKYQVYNWTLEEWNNIN